MEQAFQTIARNALKQVGRGAVGSLCLLSLAAVGGRGLSSSLPQLGTAPCTLGAACRTTALIPAAFSPSRKLKWSFTMNSPNPSN